MYSLLVSVFVFLSVANSSAQKILSEAVVNITENTDDHIPQTNTEVIIYNSTIYTPNKSIHNSTINAPKSGKLNESYEINKYDTAYNIDGATTYSRPISRDVLMESTINNSETYFDNFDESISTTVEPPMKYKNETFSYVEDKWTCKIDSINDKVDKKKLDAEVESINWNFDANLEKNITRDIANAIRAIQTNDLMSLLRFNLSICIFENSSNTIICEFIGIACDYKPFIQYDFFLRFTISFKTMEYDFEHGKGRNITSSGKNETMECLHDKCLVRLHKIKMQKIDGVYRWNNGTVHYLGPTFFIFLPLGLSKMDWEMHFSAQVAVGILYKNSDCTEDSRLQSMCINRVEMVNFPIIARYHIYGYSDGFWESFQNLMVKTLEGHEGSLNVTFKKDGVVYLNKYIKPLLNGTGLTSLSLNNYEYWSDKTSMLENLFDLKVLDLSNNNIEYIDKENFSNASNIEHLDLSWNKLETVPKDIIILTGLKFLDLSGNPLKYNQPQTSQVLRHMNNLKWLSLSNTHLNTLKNLQFLCNSTSLLLKGLDISYCNLSSLEDGNDLFRDQFLLENINLSGNTISEIPSRLFLSSNNLKSLNLSNLNLTRSPKLEFYSANVVDLIILSHNNLESLDILTSGRVFELDMSYNSVKEWNDPYVFSENAVDSGLHLKCNATNKFPTWVQTLNLSYNSISTLNTAMGRSLNDLNVVDLGGNPFSCSECNILEFRNWIRRTKDNVTSVNVLVFGAEDDLLCSELDGGSRTLIIEIESLPQVCVGINLWILTGSVIGGFVLTFLVITSLILRYRFEMSYILFLLKQKKKYSSIENNDGDYEYDAFVSYSRHDRPWVIQEMVPTLEESEERIRLCLHERDFILGSYISVNIIQAIQKSRFTLLVLSNTFVKSQWCRWELEMASFKLLDTGREFLILLELERLDPDIVPRHLRFLMDTRTYLEWPKKGRDTTEAFKRLKSCLGKSLHMQERERSQSEISSESIV